MSSDSEVNRLISNMLPMWSSVARFYTRSCPANAVALVAERLKSAYRAENPDADWSQLACTLCGTEREADPEWSALVVRKGKVNKNVYSRAV